MDHIQPKGYGRGKLETSGGETRSEKCRERRPWGCCCPPGTWLGSGTHLVDTTRVPGAHHKLLGEPYSRAVEVYAPVGLRCRGHVSRAAARLQGWRAGGPPSLRDQLGIVVRLPPQQLGLPPVEEVVQCHLRVGTDHDLVLVAPHLQANQGHAQAKRLIKLKWETAQRECLGSSCMSGGKVPPPQGTATPPHCPTPALSPPQ